MYTISDTFSGNSKSNILPSSSGQIICASQSAYDPSGDEDMVSRWVLGSIGNSELEAWICAFSFPVHTDLYTVVLIHTFDGCDCLDRHQQKTVLSICSNALPASYPMPLSYDPDENIILIVPQTLFNDILPVLDSIVQNISKVLGRQVFAAVGSQNVPQTQVPESYAAAKKVIAHYRNAVPKKVIFHSDVASELSFHGDTHSGLIINQSFETLLSNHQYPQCMAYLDDLFSQSSLSADITPSLLRSQAIELAVYVINALRRHNLDISSIVGYNSAIYSKIFSFSSIQQLHQWMRTFLSASIDALESINTHYSPCVARTVEYIKANYPQGLSLKLVANALNINAAYLGQLFKSETSQSFSSFLNEIRIENAKKLLTGSNLTLSVISQRCGYPNSSYFYNIFKKFTGQTPSQYRRNKKSQ